MLKPSPGAPWARIGAAAAIRRHAGNRAGRRAVVGGWNADAAHAGGPSLRIVSWPWSSSAFTHASDTAPRLPWVARGRSGCATVSGWTGWLSRGRSGRGDRVPPRSGGRGARPFLDARALKPDAPDRK